jgi:hypothetical protein
MLFIDSNGAATTLGVTELCSSQKGFIIAIL